MCWRRFGMEISRFPLRVSGMSAPPQERYPDLPEQDRTACIFHTRASRATRSAVTRSRVTAWIGPARADVKKRPLRLAPVCENAGMGALILTCHGSPTVQRPSRRIWRVSGRSHQPEWH